MSEPIHVTFEAVISDWTLSDEYKMIHKHLDKCAAKINDELEKSNSGFCAVVVNAGIVIEPCIRNFKIKGKFKL